jgi:sensor domain CHASE-containing protein
MEILTALIATLSGLSPASSLPWLLVIGLGIYIGKTLRGESESEKRLRAQIEKLNKIHNDSIVALTNNRVDDLKTLVKAYDDTVRQVLAALNKFGDKK